MRWSGPHSQKYLLPGPLQKRFACPHSRPPDPTSCLISTFGSSRRQLGVSKLKPREWPFHAPGPPSICPPPPLQQYWIQPTTPSGFCLKGPLDTVITCLDCGGSRCLSELGITPDPAAREIFPKGQQILSPQGNSRPRLLEKVLSSAYMAE